MHSKNNIEIMYKRWGILKFITGRKKYILNYICLITVSVILKLLSTAMYLSDGFYTGIKYMACYNIIRF